MSEREVIKTPKEFAECADRSVKGIHCLYQPIEEMMEEPASIKEAPYSTSMQILKVHKAQRLITRNGFHYVLLFVTAIQTKRKMGHFETVEKDDIKTICAKCLSGAPGWIRLDQLPSL